MTIPTQNQNQPFVSKTFLTFHIDTRQSLAASTSGKVAATIRKLQLDELIGGRRGVAFKSKVESIFFYGCFAGGWAGKHAVELCANSYRAG